MAKGLIDGSLHVEGWEAFDKALDFDKRPIRRAMHKLGKLIVGDAQMMLVLGGDDSPYPVRRTGSLARALQYKVSRSGFLVKAAPAMPAGASDYYPAYLHYGVAAGKRNGKYGRRKVPLAPRDNYMIDALEGRKDQAHSVLSAALEKGFKYKKT
ncbi:hypothetical protein [Laribacter hongkongensis]|uniref:hypothetical protein n=1 Tax=Laribacter hongkongensis TaxID=168471 RepID=UPI001EFCA5F9|nr:hypothetical protein [Laribacter hongkongensis]MCG9094456.1 hypothetical protein [Laribacter hongkongensis]